MIAHLLHHRIRCWGHRLFQKISKALVRVFKPKRTISAVATCAVAGTRGIVAVAAVVPAPVSTGTIVPVVIVTSRVATALVSRWGLGIVSTTALEASVRTLGAVERLVNANNPPVESEQRVRFLFAR